MTIKTLNMEPYGANCYLLISGEECAVVDPGAGAQRIIQEAQGLLVKYIILTHTHYDHIGAVGEVKKSLGGVIAASEQDAQGLTNSALSLGGQIQPAAEKLLRDGDELRVGQETIQVIATPGHTAGGICLLCGKDLISGDTLFQGDVGRCDLPGGDWQALQRSVREKLYTLPDDTRVYPGHGGSTTIGWEKLHNHYVRAGKE